MKKASIVTVLLILIGTTFAHIHFQSGHDLFQQALSKERSVGDLLEAIELYKRILEQFSSDTDLASKAQLRVGLCYEKLGDKNIQLARKAFEAVLETYPDQVQEVEMARLRLSRLERANLVAKSTVDAPSMRKVASFDELPGFHGSSSPNGRYLSFIDWADGNLAVFDTKTREKKVITTEGTWDADPNRFGDLSIWSHDSSQIAFTWYTGFNVELRLISRDGSNSQVLYSEKDKNLMPVHWSVDGKFILGLMTTNEENRPRKHQDHIVLVNVFNGSVQIVKSLGDRHADLGLNLSPDGRLVVYSIEQVKTSGTHDLYIVPTDGGVEYPLVEHTANDTRPIWTRDGKRILFISDRLGSEGIWSQAVQDGKPVGDPELILSLENVLPLGMTDDGSLVIAVGKEMRDIFIGTLDPQTGKLNPRRSKVGEKLEGINSHPAWSTDGRYLAYFAIEGNGSSKLVIRDCLAKSEREVTIKSNKVVDEKYASWSRSSWTPDGSGITTVGIKDVRSTHHLYQIDILTGEVSTVFSTDTDHFIRDHRWSVDGKSIYYLRSAVTEDYVGIVSLDPISGSETELYRSEKPDVITHFALSPDGEDLVFRSAGTSNASTRDTLKLLSTKGGQPRVLMDETVQENYNISVVAGMEWTPDGEWIIFGRWHNYPSENNQLFRISATGGQSETLGEPFPFGSIRVSPDGKTLAYLAIHMGSGSGIWVLSDFISE